MRHWLLFGLWLVSVVGLSACEDQAVTMTSEKVGNRVRLYAETRDGMDVTLTLTAELQNMASTPALPLTLDLTGRGRKLVAELNVVNPSQAWRWRYNYRYFRGHRGGRHNDALYLLPYRAGEAYPLSQGNRGKFSHGVGTADEYAFDFTMPVGTTICAARDGVVAGVRTDSNAGGPNPNLSNCANYIMVRHDDGTYADYLHLQQGGALVRVGERVRAGQPIARSGNTGFSTTPHLHFVVYRTIDGTRRESLPIKFSITGMSGPVSLVQGNSYIDRRKE